MGIKTWEWEKSLHTVTSKHLQKALIAFKFICDCLGFSVFIHNYWDVTVELPNGNGNGMGMGTKSLK